MKNATLFLSLHKAAFDVMVTGEKQIEFRKPSNWIKSRFTKKNGHCRGYDFVKFVNGYGSDKPYFIAEFHALSEASSEYTINYSNGLSVDIVPGIMCISFGKIIEKGNLK